MGIPQAIGTLIGSVIGLIILIAIAVYWVRTRKQADDTWARRRIIVGENKHKFEEECSKRDISNDLTISAKAYYHSSTTVDVFGFRVDYGNKKIAVSSFEEDAYEFHVFDFNDIISYKIIDGVSNTTSESYTTGGAVATRFGAVGGGTTNTYTETTIEKPRLKINTKSSYTGVQIMLYTYQVDVTSSSYQSLVTAIEDICSVLDKILDENENGSRGKNNTNYAVKKNSAAAVVSISKGNPKTAVSLKPAVVVEKYDTFEPDSPKLRRALMLIEDGEMEKAYQIVDDYLLDNPESYYAYVITYMIENKLHSVTEIKNCDDFLGNSNIKRAYKYADSNQKKQLDYLYASNPKNMELMEQKKAADAIKEEEIKKQNAEELKEILEAEKQNEEAEKEEYYLKAVEQMKNEYYDNAIEFFTKARGYKDSISLKEECLKTLEKQKKYSEAVNMLHGTKQDREIALSILFTLNYKDSAELYNKYKK